MPSPRNRLAAACAATLFLATACGQQVSPDHATGSAQVRASGDVKDHGTSADATHHPLPVAPGWGPTRAAFE